MIQLSTFLYFTIFVASALFSGRLFWTAFVTDSISDEFTGYIFGTICGIVSFVFFVLYLIQVGVIIT